MGGENSCVAACRRPREGVFAEGGVPTFSIIIPLEFHRGQAVKCLETWVRGQTYPRDRFEVIVVAPMRFPADALERIRRILTAQDQVLLRGEEHDMPLVVEGAAVAKGDVLFFTESHCWPEADVLEKCAEALRDHPEWAGFSCRSVRKTHNRLSVLEADMYEADIRHGMKHHPWRKILDQCFVARRDFYFRAGGFDASLGHFAEWLLAAKYYHMGMKIGYFPQARVRHFYIGEVEEWEEFTDDFVKGEIQYLARVEKDADPCADLFEPVPEWVKRHDWDASMARGMAEVIWQDLLHRRENRNLPREQQVPHWRLLAQWTPAALTGAWGERLISALRCVFLRFRLMWQTRFSESGTLKAAMQHYIRSLQHARRLKYLEAVKREVPLAPGSGEWIPGKPTPVKLAGFHLPEICGGQPCCWSQPAAEIHLPVAEGCYEVVVQWLPVRSEDQPPLPRFYGNGRPLEADSAGAFGVRLKVRSQRGGNGIRLAWVCQPMVVAGDGRELGLFVRRIVWRRVVEAGTVPDQPPLFMLHIRKTAGVSVRDLISNRFLPEKCLFQAHARENSGVDPSRFSFVTGHVPFGYLSRFARRPLVFTVLRDPLDRALSALYFFRGNREPFMRQLEAELSAEEFAERKRIAELSAHSTPLEFLEAEPELARKQLGNTMVRAFLRTPHDGNLKAADLAEAVNNLATCDVIGLFERLPESMSLLQKAMRWEGLGPVPHHNPTSHRRRVAEEDPQVIQILTGWNDLDSQLYTRGEELFEEQLRKSRTADVPVSLPSARRFTFDQPVHGYGWHIREKNGERWICWTGADDHAWIDLAIEGPANSLLSCRVSHFVSNEALNGLRVLVNDRPVELKKREDDRGLLLEAAVDVWMLYANNERVRIKFLLAARQRPDAQNLAMPDKRILSVALESICLQPF